MLNIQEVNQRIIKIKVCLHGIKVTIVGTYTINHDTEEFFEDLSYEISDKYQTDLNARTDNRHLDPIIGQFGENILNDNGCRLIFIYNQNDLRVSNWTQEFRNSL